MKAILPITLLCMALTVLWLPVNHSRPSFDWPPHTVTTFRHDAIYNVGHGDEVEWKLEALTLLCIALLGASGVIALKR